MRKIRSINDVNMGDVLMYENLLGTVSFFGDDTHVVLETIVEVEVMDPEGMATLQIGSDFDVDALDCYLVLTRNAMNNPNIQYKAAGEE